MIEEFEVDGVQVVFAKRPGPMTAGLVFRVGQSDETLPDRGVTHLVEHLALYHQNLSDYHSNGATSSVHTSFHMEGTEPDVVSFLDGVCRSLTDLPMHRLEVERDVLRTEEAGRHRANGLPVWRYGARGYGLPNYPELGLRRLSADEVVHWARTWFNRSNAVAWVVGEQVPTGLRLRLPDGVRHPVPVATSALDGTPAWFASGAGQVAMDAVVARSTAAQVFSGVLQRELFRSLRQDGGYCYTADAGYQPRDSTFATITAVADALPEKQDAVLGGFVDVLAKIRVGRLDQADLDAVRAQTDGHLAQPDADAARLVGYARNLLTGHPNQTIERLRAELRAVTLDDVHRVAVDALDSALLQVPVGRNADWAGFVPAPTGSPTAVDGIGFACRTDPDTSVVIGPDGVSVMCADGPVTIRFQDCAVKLDWPDGGRRLIGADGLIVDLEPTLFDIDQQALAAVDAAVPPSCTVRMPERPPSAIPRPDPEGTAGPDSARRLGRRGEAVVLAVLTLLTLFLGGVAVFGTIGAATDPATKNDAWLGVAIFWAFAAVPGFQLCLRLHRRAQGRR